MERGFGWLPFHDMDWASWIEHRQRHLEAVMAKARHDDDEREVQRMLDEIDAAVAAGSGESPPSPGDAKVRDKLQHLSEHHYSALAEPCRCPECRREAEQNGAS